MTSKHPPPRAEISKIWAFFTKKGLILQKNHLPAEIHNLGGHYKRKLLEKMEKTEKTPLLLGT